MFLFSFELSVWLLKVDTYLKILLSFGIAVQPSSAMACAVLWKQLLLILILSAVNRSEWKAIYKHLECKY